MALCHDDRKTRKMKIKVWVNVDKVFERENGPRVRDEALPARDRMSAGWTLLHVYSHVTSGY